MVCIHCGHLCDFHESYICELCRKKLADIDLRVHLFDLLLQAYPYVEDIRLREKIEAVMCVQGVAL